jgi:two-component system sensor histidine kinase FlrB
VQTLLYDGGILSQPATSDTLPASAKHIAPEELEQAFSLFNLASEQLTGAYQGLQQQVERLTSELAIANGELRRQLLEKEALSQRLAHLLAAMPAGVMVLDQQGVVIDANPAAHTMFSGNLPGTPWKDIAQRHLTPTVLPNEWELALAEEGAATRRVSITGSPLDSAGGQVLVILDITEAYATQRELQRHQRLSAMGEMAAGLAHQLRTPLATALLYTAHLSKPALAESERLRFAEKSLTRLRHLEHLIQDMLMFVKGETVGQETFAITALLAELQQVIEPQLSPAVRLEVTNRCGEATLQCNRKALSGALLNLLENAMQACRNGGTIRLTGEKRGKRLILTVADDGPGIAQDVQERVFEPFFTTRSDGTGLGLAIVRGVAEAHGGDIHVESAPGQGSRFILNLPLGDAP